MAGHQRHHTMEFFEICSKLIASLAQQSLHLFPPFSLVQQYCVIRMQLFAIAVLLCNMEFIRMRRGNPRAHTFTLLIVHLNTFSWKIIIAGLQTKKLAMSFSRLIPAALSAGVHAARGGALLSVLAAPVLERLVAAVAAGRGVTPSFPRPGGVRLVW